MEKIININFQGRVLPIEESAYDALRQYTDGLRSHFASEESGDEIINDIESRIAELLAARLKQGANCINIGDLNAVIDSIGRIDDIRAADGEDATKPGSAAAQPERPILRERFHRNADDKVIAGVCSGIANRMNIDPVVTRILFVMLFGALFWIYILLWLIVPLRSSSTNITHRLFRNPDNKVVGGVCGGLAVYFRMDSWKIRLIFLFPLIISILFSSMDIFTWHLGLAPGFFIGSFGSAFFMLYVILWIAIPYANSATDKMEMRGEKIDINSIKAATQARAGAGHPSRPAGSGLGRVIGILFKAFFLLVAGSVALGLFAALIGLVFAGMATMPFSGFLLTGWGEHVLTWTGIALTMGIPLLALMVWLIRRFMGVRSRSHYLGYVFAGLWVIGLTCALLMAGTIAGNFRTRAAIEEEMQIEQPSAGSMYIVVSDNKGAWQSSRHNRWFGDDWDAENDEFYIISKDSLWLNTVKVNIEQSPDSLFHVHETRAARAASASQARQIAGHILFSIEQQDSIISLGRGFAISSKDKFRNQQVIMTVEVPLGKKVQVSKDVSDYSWFTINEHGRGVHYTRHQENAEGYRADKEYIMTVNGLRRTDTKEDDGEEHEEDEEEEGDNSENQ